MPSISPMIFRVFDDPHATHRRGGRPNRARTETKGRVFRRRSR
jgi:hypothetical protein